MQKLPSPEAPTLRVRSSARLAGVLSISCLIAAAPRQLCSQWSEDFDGYPAGGGIVGAGGWTSWDETPGIDADVSDDTAASAPSSLKLRPSSDVVQVFRGVREGVWVMRAKTFIPSDHTGATVFILLNRYAAGGPSDWSTQVVFADGAVFNQGGTGFTGGGVLPWIPDEWVDLEVELDLDANVQAISYGGELLDETPWQVGGLPELQALDLYSAGGTPAYFDDLALAPVTAGPRSRRSIAVEGACPDAAPVVVSVRQPLAEGADPGELVTVTETVRNVLGTAEVQPANGGEAQDIFPEVVDGNGFVRAWLLLGPFLGHSGHDDPGCIEMQRDFLTDGAVTELTVVPEAGQTVNTAFGGAAGSNGVAGPEALNPGGVPTWNAHHDTNDTVDFNREYYHGDIDDVMMYAFTYITAADDVDVDLCIASDDAVEVLIDSRKVWCNSVSREVGPPLECADTVPFGVLSRGEHTVMVKVFDGSAGHGFRFAFQLAGTGEPAPGISACLQPVPSACRLQPVGASVTWNVTRDELSRGVGYTVAADRGRLEFVGAVGGLRTLGRASTLACRGPTDPQGLILESQFIALGPFFHQARFTCDGEAPYLLGNHIANARIYAEYPSPGDAIDYDAAAAVTTGYAGPLDDSGKPFWRSFDDGSEDGRQDMTAGFGRVENGMGWLVTYIEYTGAEPADIHVCLGSGDGGQLWWGCDLLASTSSCGDIASCSFRIHRRVEPGVHRLAAGAWHRSGNWGLSVRLLKSDEVTPIVGGDPEWRFLGGTRPDGLVPPRCGPCGPEPVAGLQCAAAMCGEQEGIVLSWTNPPVGEPFGSIGINAGGARVATVPADATRACIARTDLPAGAAELSVVNCSGVAAACRPFHTSAEGWIADDSWLVVGPFLNASDGCDGTGDLRANHIAPSQIECLYPAAGDEVPYDPAAAGQASVRYLGPLGPGGNPLVVPFGDGLDDGNLQLDSAFDDRSNVMAWLVTYVEYTGEPVQVAVCVESDDDAQVWLNDFLVLTDVDCAPRHCESPPLVDVEPGVHRIAVGFWENVGAWGGRLSLIDPETSLPILDDGTGPWRFLGTERPPAARFPGGDHPCPGGAPRFHRGDADGNGQLQLTDSLRLFGVLFLGSGSIGCEDAADADDNGALQLSDGVLILHVLFLGNGVIAPPGPTNQPCGVDPTADPVGCLSYDPCR